MKLCISILCLLLCFSCKTDIGTVKTNIKEIKFGYGGGFTGEVKTFKLNIKGELFEKEKRIKTINTKITSEIFKEVQELKDYTFSLLSD